jgi:hypothetical protein
MPNRSIRYRLTYYLKIYRKRNSQLWVFYSVPSGAKEQLSAVYPGYVWEKL